MPRVGLAFNMNEYGISLRYASFSERLTSLKMPLMNGKRATFISADGPALDTDEETKGEFSKGLFAICNAHRFQTT